MHCDARTPRKPHPACSPACGSEHSSLQPAVTITCRTSPGQTCPLHPLAAHQHSGARGLGSGCAAQGSRRRWRIRYRHHRLRRCGRRDLRPGDSPGTALIWAPHAGPYTSAAPFDAVVLQMHSRRQQICSRLWPISPYWYTHWSPGLNKRRRTGACARMQSLCARITDTNAGTIRGIGSAYCVRFAWEVLPDSYRSEHGPPMTKAGSRY